MSSRRMVLVLGAGQSCVPEIAGAPEQGEWKRARVEYRGHLSWEAQLASVLAREDGWAVIVLWSWGLIDAVDADDACVSWCDFFEQEPERRDLLARRPT